VEEEAFAAYAAGGIVDYAVAEAAAGVWGLLALREGREDRKGGGRKGRGEGEGCGNEMGPEFKERYTHARSPRSQRR
jgi:hypothetical protein